MSATTTTTPETWEEGIARLFGRLANPIPVLWKEQPRPHLPDGAVLLKVIADVSQGTDEYRIAIDTTKLTSSPPEECVPTSCGSSRVTLQVQAEAFDQSASSRARTTLRRIRQRLRWPSSLAALKTIETSLIDIISIPVVDKTQDGRQYSLATMDVRLNTIQTEDDAAFGRIDSIVIQPNMADDVGGAISTPPFTIDLPDP